MLTYESVPQILDMVGRVHERLFHELEGVSADQSAFRAEVGCWTIAEIVEHLANVQEGMGKVTSKLLKDAEAAGAKGREDKTIGPISMEFVMELAKQKFQAPENVRPGGGVPIEDSVNRLKANYQRLRDMTDRIEASDLSGPTFPHVAFGPLNAYQWLALIGLHESKHIDQVRTIKAASGYPGT